MASIAALVITSSGRRNRISPAIFWVSDSGATPQEWQSAYVWAQKEFDDAAPSDRGDLLVESVPGETRFIVLLLLDVPPAVDVALPE